MGRGGRHRARPGGYLVTGADLKSDGKWPGKLDARPRAVSDGDQHAGGVRGRRRPARLDQALRLGGRRGRDGRGLGPSLSHEVDSSESASTPSCAAPRRHDRYACRGCGSKSAWPVTPTFFRIERSWRAQGGDLRAGVHRDLRKPAAPDPMPRPTGFRPATVRKISQIGRRRLTLVGSGNQHHRQRTRSKRQLGPERGDRDDVRHASVGLADQHPPDRWRAAPAGSLRRSAWRASTSRNCDGRRACRHAPSIRHPPRAAVRPLGSVSTIRLSVSVTITAAPSCSSARPATDALCS